MSTPTAREYQLAYELLRPVPLTASPVEHFARLIAEYRAELFADQQPKEGDPCPDNETREHD